MSTEERLPCAMDRTDSGARRHVKVKRVDEVASMHELFTHCLPAFGGAFLRRIYSILDTAIGMGCPLTVSIAGPITVSGQLSAVRCHLPSSITSGLLPT